jgi:hypothetical protein
MVDIYPGLDDGWYRTWLSLTVRTVRMKLPTGPFRLGHLLYLQAGMKLIFKTELFYCKAWKVESEKRSDRNHEASTPSTFTHK